MALRNIQKQVDDYIKNHGVRYFNELTNMTLLTEEVGELARHMARQFGDQSYKKNELSAPPSMDAAKGLLADEMADVLWVLICLANQTGVNLTEAFKKNMENRKNQI